jgi:hypothetical protein
MPIPWSSAVSPTLRQTDAGSWGFPNGSFDLINCIEADANAYGTVYVGKGGGGFSYGKLI